MELSGEPVLRNDPEINFQWGTGEPAAGIRPDGFSARWTRRLAFSADTYRFSLRVDDGARLWIDGEKLIDQWQDGPVRTLVAEQFLDEGEHDIRVEMYDRAGDATAQLWWEKEQTFPDWKGEYFANPGLDGEPQVVRNDKVIDFHWGTDAPTRGLAPDGFSIRWTRELYTPDGLYRFSVEVDDGARLWVDGLAIIDEWHDGQAIYTGEATLDEGKHAVQLEMYEHTGDALVRFRWELTDTEPLWRAKYYGNPSLQGPPVLARNDAQIDFNWGDGAPAPGLPDDSFSVRWVLRQHFAAGTYRFCARADDGVIVVLDDGDILINEWHDGSGIYCADRNLSEGMHKLRVEYYESLGGAVIQFQWKRSGDD